MRRRLFLACSMSWLGVCTACKTARCRDALTMLQGLLERHGMWMRHVHAVKTPCKSCIWSRHMHCTLIKLEIFIKCIYYNKCKWNRHLSFIKLTILDHSLSFILIISCLTKNNLQQKHITIKAIRCTLFSLCVLLNMLQVLRDFKHFNNC